MFVSESNEETKIIETKESNEDLNQKEKIIAVDGSALKMRLENNPVFKSFEDAKDVDDLYRIAEQWVNPSFEA